MVAGAVHQHPASYKNRFTEPIQIFIAFGLRLGIEAITEFSGDE